MANRKLGRAGNQRRAILRNLVTALIWNGKIVTTEARAKEVRSIAEKFITLAIKEYDHTLTVKKSSQNERNQTMEIEVVNDLPSKLHARRLIMAYFYDVPEPKLKDENKPDYRERTKDNRHPVVEKLFREIAPKYDKRAKELGQGGGYTRMLKMGPRRGDAAPMVVLELV